MGKKTPLYEIHQSLNAKLVDFAGWDMPIHYGSQIEEHHLVRKTAGMFDVSHMLAVELTGADTKSFLQTLLANNVDKLQQPGDALYSCMLNVNGGVIDDLIVYYVAPESYRIVVNAGTREKDVAWMEENSKNLDVQIKCRTDLAVIAVQGPEAREKALQVLPKDLSEKASKIKRFSSTQLDDWFVGRTGYTGEDGFEIMLPAAAAVDLWEALAQQGVAPVGLGARDTLRLEAGMNLYGSDMDENVNPLEAGLAWTIAWEPQQRDFIGRQALMDAKARGLEKKLVGLILQDRGVLRSHQKVVKDGKVIGETTSGSFSPTLGQSIAFAHIRRDVVDECGVEIRNKELKVKIVKAPFVKNGKSVH